jgi:preprotein translocase subunit Sec63
MQGVMLEKNATHKYDWEKPIIVIVGFLLLLFLLLNINNLLLILNPIF